ncbi:MAG: FecR family protein [Chitinophagaceae bacterium]
MIQQLINKYFHQQNPGAQQEELASQFQLQASETDIDFSESEWDDMPAAKLERTDKAEAFLNGIVQEEETSSNRILPMRRWLVAASVILLAGIGALYLFSTSSKPGDAASKAPIAVAAAKPVVHNITQKNTLSRPMNFQLPDGFMVALSPNSEISYLPQLEENKRDIYLEGEAVFTVAHDAQRPFSVYCKEVQTTALGTKFKVSALKDSSRVAVFLLEGKILVRSTVATAYNGPKYYLLPGNEIEYNRINSRFTLNAGNISSATVAKVTIANPEASSEEATADAHIQVNAEKKFIKFNDVGMAKVLNVIANKYGVSIAYPTERINDIRFVGTVNEHDAVQTILYNITSINNLELIADTAHKKYTIR